MGLVQEYLIMILIVLGWLFLGFLKSVEPAAVLTTDISNASATAKPQTLSDIERELEGLVSSISKMALPYVVRNSDIKLSPSCMSTLVKMFMDIRKLKLPVVKLLDAMAKPPYGLLRGTFNMMGDYDECLEVRATKKGEVALTKEEEFYHGQYCVLEVDFPKALVDTINDYSNKKVNISVFGKLGTFINEISATNFAKNYFTYYIGLCLPSTCSVADVKEILNLVPVTFLPMHVNRCDDGQRKAFSVDQIAFIIFLALFGVLIACGTSLEAWFYVKYSTFKGHHKGKLAQFLLAFSVYGNTKKLMKTAKKSQDGEIPVVNGMYVFGTLLVVIYHTYFMPFFLRFASHGGYIGDYLKDIKFTLISTMGISIEAYFLFSGLFLVYPRFRRGQKEVNVNIIKIIVRRYIRLCPSMLLILGIVVFLPIFGSGPVWADIFDVAADNTRKWWYTYVLMYNNFLEIKNQTFLYLWFIPCLMQISIVGAILLWIIAKSPKLGIGLSILTGVTCNIVLGVLTATRHYPPTYAIYYYHNRGYFEETIYTAPLSHAFSYFIGMFLGLFMAKNPSLTLSKKYVIIGWILALFSTIGIQFIAYIGHEGLDPDPTFAAIYAATHRTIFSLGLSWIILVCTHGYGGAFGRVLCWRGFAVLSKLCYLAYLIHYIVITYHVSSSRIPVMYSHYEIFMRFCGYSLLTFVSAYILYITFEAPLVYIESLFLPSRPSNLEIENNNFHQNGKSTNVFTIPYNGDLSSNTYKTSLSDAIIIYPGDNENNEHSKL